NVVAVPSRECGDLSRTERAKALLLFPESQQFPSSPKVVYRFHVETLLKVHFPFRVVGISLTSDFGVPLNGDTSCFEELYRMECSIPRDAQRVVPQKSNWRESVLHGSHVCRRQREPFLTPNRGKAELIGWGPRSAVFLPDAFSHMGGSAFVATAHDAVHDASCLL